MKTTRTGLKEIPEIISLESKRRKRAPRPGRSGGYATATSGSTALRLDLEQMPERRPVRFPTPTRWFSENHGAIGFRLFDIVYFFALARQALTSQEACEWGARYFSGMMSEEHGRTVLNLLVPGMGEQAELNQIPDSIRQGFRDAVAQGAGRLLGRSHLQVEDVTREDGIEMQKMLEELYERNGWLLPTVPITLHRMLRYSDQMYDY